MCYNVDTVLDILCCNVDSVLCIMHYALQISLPGPLIALDPTFHDTHSHG